MPIRYKGSFVNSIRYLGGDVNDVFYPLPGDPASVSDGDSDALRNAVMYMWSAWTQQSTSGGVVSETLISTGANQGGAVTETLINTGATSGGVVSETLITTGATSGGTVSETLITTGSNTGGVETETLITTGSNTGGVETETLTNTGSNTGGGETVTSTAVTGTWLPPFDDQISNFNQFATTTETYNKAAVTRTDTYQIDTTAVTRTDTYQIDTTAVTRTDTYQIDTTAVTRTDTYQIDTSAVTRTDTYRIDTAVVFRIDQYSIDTTAVIGHETRVCEGSDGSTGSPTDCPVDAHGQDTMRDVVITAATSTTDDRTVIVTPFSTTTEDRFVTVTAASSTTENRLVVVTAASSTTEDRVVIVTAATSTTEDRVVIVTAASSTTEGRVVVVSSAQTGLTRAGANASRTVTVSVVTGGATSESGSAGDQNSDGDTIDDLSFVVYQGVAGTDSLGNAGSNLGQHVVYTVTQDNTPTVTLSFTGPANAQRSGHSNGATMSGNVGTAWSFSTTWTPNSGFQWADTETTEARTYTVNGNHINVANTPVGYTGIGTVEAIPVTTDCKNITAGTAVYPSISPFPTWGVTGSTGSAQLTSSVSDGSSGALCGGLFSQSFAFAFSFGQNGVPAVTDGDTVPASAFPFPSTAAAACMDNNSLNFVYTVTQSGIAVQNSDVPTHSVGSSCP